MKKFTYLLSLFLLMAGTVMAQTFAKPDAEKVLTAEALRALTTETTVALCPVQYSMYEKWYDGSASTSYGTSDTFSDANVFVWVPILNGEAATGTGYLKKYAAESEDAAWLQTANTTTFGAQATAQVFYAQMPVQGGEGSATFDHGNILENLDEGRLVRLVCGTADGTAWFNFNGKQYNGGTGIWTAMEIREVSESEEPETPVYTPVVITSLDQLSNNKAYTLVTKRSQLAVNADGTQLRTANDLSLSFDTANEQFRFAILKNNKDQYYLYSVKAGKFATSNMNELSENPTESVSFYDNGDGRFVPYFDLSHFINMGGSKQLVIDNWGPGGNGSADDGNIYTITDVADFTPSEELLAKLNSVSVTFKYMVGEKLYAEVTKDVPAGTVLSAESFTDLSNEYVTAESWDVTEAISEDVTVTVNCVAAELPFVVSESVDDATWYYVDMHSNDTGDGEVSGGVKNYIWTATTETEAEAITAAEITLPKYDVKQTAAFADNMMWCFVGNVVDGFTIYNKAVGSEYALAKPATGNTAVKFAAVADATPFRLYKSTQVDGGTCFKTANDDHYINTQKVDDVKVLRGWTDTDGGSSCRFFAPNHYMLNYAEEMPAGPANALGVARYFNEEGVYETFAALTALAETDPFNEAVTENLEAFIADYLLTEENATPNDAVITDGGYYRLMNVATKSYLAANGTDLSTDEAADAATKAATVVKFIANGENYNLSVQGLYLGIDNTLTDEEGKADYQVSQNGGKFVFGTDATSPKWYILPATSVNVALNGGVAEEKTYTTTCLPFGVTLPEDGTVKAYIVTAAENGEVTRAEVTDVPANQGVVLEGQTTEVADVTLTIAEAAADCTGNLLKGTSAGFNVEQTDAISYYVMTDGEKGLGFYPNTAEAVSANSAYLAAEDVTVTEGKEYFLLYPEVIPPVEEYPVNFDKDAAATRTDRYITDIKFTAGNGESQVINVNQAKPYVDNTATELTCVEGDEINVEIGFNAFWMHGYVYVDMDNDGQFSFNEGSLDQSGTDVMSYSFYSGDFNNDASGQNSEGTQLTGDARNTMVTPAFTAPATAGTYRIRFKLDWNSVDPGGQLAADGTPTGANGILANGGMIVDATLVVTQRTGIEAVETEDASASKAIFDLSGRRLTKVPAHGVFIMNGKKMVK